MKKLLKAAMVLALIGFAFVEVSAVFAQAKDSATAVTVKSEAKKVKPDYTIRLAYHDAATWPSVSKNPLPEHAFTVVFKSVVEANTNGKVAVEFFPANADHRAYDPNLYSRIGSHCSLNDGFYSVRRLVR